MQSRITPVAAGALVVAVIGTIGGILLFGGSAEPLLSGPTTLPATTSTTTTIVAAPTTPATTTTMPATTTTTLPPKMTLTFTSAQSSPRLEPIVLGFYTWLVDRSADEPDIPDGLAAHVGGIGSDQTFDLTAEIYKDELADGSKVAVVLVGDDDVILAVTEGSGWKIIGARLTGFGLDPWYGEPIRHVLIIGTDARPYESQPELRADSIHIVAASMPERGGAVVGFPRDTWVAASYGSDKFSSVNVRADTDEMVRIAEDLSGLSMEGYILTGFAGFKRLVNRLGGIEVDIPFRMSDGSSNAFLDAGLQVLRGNDALAFSRNRHIAGGDFTRSFHQGVVIQAGLTGAQAMKIRRLPTLIRILTEYSWTDLSTTQLLQLGATAFELDPANIQNVVLPGQVGSVRGASVVRLTSGADTIFADLADGVLTAD